MTGIGRDRHLSVSVNAPSGLLMSTVDDAKGQITFEAKETGSRPPVCRLSSYKYAAQSVEIRS